MKNFNERNRIHYVSEWSESPKKNLFQSISVYIYEEKRKLQNECKRQPQHNTFVHCSWNMKRNPTYLR